VGNLNIDPARAKRQASGGIRLQGRAVVPLTSKDYPAMPRGVGDVEQMKSIGNNAQLG
jgi:hypothetical protein